MDIVDDLKNLQDALLTQGAMMCVSDVSVAITEIIRLREQLAASQAECIALQNRMDEQVTAWRAEWMAAENKLIAATDIADRHASDPADSDGRATNDYSVGWQDAALQILSEIEDLTLPLPAPPKDETK